MKAIRNTAARPVAEAACQQYKIVRGGVQKVAATTEIHLMPWTLTAIQTRMTADGTTTEQCVKPITLDFKIMKQLVILIGVAMSVIAVDVYAQTINETHGMMLERIEQEIQKKEEEGRITDIAKYLTDPLPSVQNVALKKLANTKEKNVVPQLLDYLDSIKDGVEGSEAATVNVVLKERAVDAIEANSGLDLSGVNARSPIEVERAIRRVASELGLPEPKLRPQEVPPFMRSAQSEAKLETDNASGSVRGTGKSPLAQVATPQKTSKWLWIAGAVVATMVLTLLLRFRGRGKTE
jgi:hypothetical protein